MHPRLAGHGLRRVRKQAFTLIELLVVIGSTMILGCLLVAATTKSQQTARNAQCISNLRQIGIGVQAYASENDGRIVPSRVSAGPDGYWPYLLAPYLGMPKLGITPAGSVSNSVYTCPVKQADSAGKTEYIMGVYALRYAINSHIAEVPDLSSQTNITRSCRMAQMNPTKTMIFMDGFPGGLGWLTGTGSTYPHNNRGDVLYLDGHVETKTPKDIDRYRQYPFHVFWRGYDWGNGGYRED